MFGVGRDLCGSSSPTLLPKQGLLQEVALPPKLPTGDAQSRAQERGKPILTY